jgi:cysteine-rich repeat protein
VSAAHGFTVVKLDGATGAQKWRYDVDSGPSSVAEALAVAVDATGDVVALGYAPDGVDVQSVTAVKLAGATGAPLWTTQHAFPGTPPVDVALLPGGDPVVAADFVQRLDGATGAETWHAQIPTQNQWYGSVHVVVTPGAVVVGGTAGVPASQIAALAPDTGAPLWIQSKESLESVVARPDGNLALLQIDFHGDLWNLRVSTVRTADGTTVVTRELPEYPNEYVGFNGMALTATGDVIVAVQLPRSAPPTPDPAQEIGLVRLAADDLHDVWTRRLSFLVSPFSLEDPFARVPALGATRGYLPVYVRQILGVDLGGTNQFIVVAFDLADGAVDVCGDGIADPGEACDDGNTMDGDCCSADCTHAAADGTACDDGNACTVGDVCTHGACAGPTPLPCAPCGQCDPQSGCHDDGRYTCAGPTTTDAAMLRFTRPRRGRDTMSWTMRSGPATSLAQLGDPRTTSGYALCAYDSKGLIGLATAPAGPCGKGGACWHRVGRGFVYDDPRAPGGISHLSVHAGPAGRARFAVSARGPNLVVPTLPLGDRDVTVQLRRSDDTNACWTADHTNVRTNRTTVFRARGD